LPVSLRSTACAAERHRHCGTGPRLTAGGRYPPPCAAELGLSSRPRRVTPSPTRDHPTASLTRPILRARPDHDRRRSSALDAIDLPATDNPLPRRLHQQAGLSSRQLAKSAATLLDVDTPTDAARLARHPKCPPELRSLPAWQEILAERIEALMRLVTTPDKELLVAGRVGAPVWTFIETQTACRVRMLAEERGMQAAGRDTSGEARSALGFLYEKIGPREFFARMRELCDGMLFDTLVLFAHLGWRPGAAERFASYLFMAERIQSKPLREFTEAAREAPFPLLLGGHTLVSGVLWTMVEAAWAGHPET